MGGGQSVLFTTDPRTVRNEREKVSERVLLQVPVTALQYGHYPISIIGVLY
jgi:hypothetical protein